MIATPLGESSGTCECCGRTSKKIWGELSANDAVLAVYFVHWTEGAPEHMPNFDILMGAWGEGAEPHNRVLVSLLFRPSVDGGAFMVIDAHERLARFQDLCTKAMRRSEVVGTPLATDVFALVDAVWLEEPRIAEVRAFNNAA